jgi:hypothetical protein
MRDAVVSKMGVIWQSLSLYMKFEPPECKTDASVSIPKCILMPKETWAYFYYNVVISLAFKLVLTPTQPFVSPEHLHKSLTG